jgi:hypothetical protein
MFTIGRTPGSSRIYESVISPPCESPFAAMAAILNFTHVSIEPHA